MGPTDVGARDGAPPPTSPGSTASSLLEKINDQPENKLDLLFLCICLGNELKLKKIAGVHFWVKAIPLFNPFVPNAPFLYPLKTSENLCFQGVEKGCVGNK